ncbi:MAG: hypothetical protein QXS32_08390 [Candidatus Nezhaarchaeales archaeon]
MAVPVQWIREAIFEKKHGMHDYTWWCEVVIPANTEVGVVLQVPSDEVWLESGYEFEPEELDKFQVSHYHDGRPQFRDLLISESTLSLYYVKHEVVEKVATVYIKNNDATRNLRFRMIARYRVIPRELYVKTYQEV